MKKNIQPQQLFELPEEWARWHAIVELGDNLIIQLVSLKYPRWDSSFYPVFIKNHKSIFKFPIDLLGSSKDGRLWQC